MNGNSSFIQTMNIDKVLFSIVASWTFAIVCCGSTGKFRDYECATVIPTAKTGAAGTMQTVSGELAYNLPISSQLLVTIDAVTGKNFKLGAVLYCQMKILQSSLQHFGVYVGDDKIVHMTLDGIKISNIKWEGSVSPWLNFIRPLSYVAKSKGYYPDTGSCAGPLRTKCLVACSDDPEAAKRALNDVGKPVCYNLNSCNCEHWANYWKAGFISTRDDVVPGNNGMKDQVAALKWVQKNIAAFGGNPKSVTLFGNSAGGASVHYHYLSPLSDGLFHRGFSQSGSPLNPWAFCEKNVEKTLLLASTLGCPTHDSKELIGCLRERPANSISLFTSNLQSWLYNPFSPWAPSIEINSSKSFLSEDPYKLLERGQVKDLPWLISYTSEEGLYPVTDFAEKTHLLRELDAKWNEIAPSLLDFVNTIPPEDQKPVSTEIRRHYFGDSSISMDTFKNLIQVVSDRLYVVGIKQAVRFQAAANRSPVYLLHFAAPIKKSFATFFSGSDKNYGVSHCDDLAYMLKLAWGEPTSSEEDWALSRLLINVLISFTKKGVPCAGNTSLPAVSRNIKRVGDIEYLEIRSHVDLKIQKQQSLNTHEFWTSFGYSTY